MKKVNLFILASLFSLGVIAQTSPSSTPKQANIQARPASNSTATAKATSATSSGAAKTNLKKTIPTKKGIHRVTTTTKKINTPASTKGATNQNTNLMK